MEIWGINLFSALIGALLAMFVLPRIIGLVQSRGRTATQ